MNGDHDDPDEAPDTTVNVVLFQYEVAPPGQSGPPTVIPVLATSPADLTTRHLDTETVGDLIDSSTVLTAPDGVPIEVVGELLASPVPEAFRHNPWLREHRALVFTDGRCRIGGHTLHYHQEFGVYVDDTP